MKQTIKQKILKHLSHFCIVTVGAVLYAASISMFLDPNQLAPGGVSGIAIILNELLGRIDVHIGTGLIILILNTPLMILGTIRFKWKFLSSTLYATGLSSFLMDYTDFFVPKSLIPITSTPILAAIAGGALMAVGMGLVLRGGATTGGFDIIVKLLRQKYKYLKSGIIFFCLDAAILVVTIFVYGDIDTTLYAAIGLLISSFLLDIVLYGNDQAKLVYIISDHPANIEKRIVNELEAGVTYIDGRGAYSGKDKDVIMTAVHKQLYTKVREIVKTEDPEAFMIITSATEIFGLGFKNQYDDEV